ncbi:MAG: tyrosine-type recombinase/integrase [Acholeplasmataceae bacterium]
MNLQELISRYQSYIKRQFSNGTYRFYQSHLSHFQRWLFKRGITDHQDIKYFHFDDYISDMKLSCSNSTINKRIGILKRFFNYVNIDMPYLQSIQKLKERSKTFEALDLETYQRLRKHIKNYPEELTNGLYHKLFLALLADTGARIQEIMFIEIKNINIDDCQILLTQTKTKEDRYVYFTKTLSYSLIKKMMKIKHDHPYLLHNIDKNRQANYDDIRYILRQLKKQLKIDHIHPHMFRHTFATYMIQSGMDLPTLMQVLGHRNLETTKRYLHVSKMHVKNSYLKSMNQLD